ncbi:MAG: hypothetical protein K0Q57_156 [Gammaproteobacteria bacterium]|jgi:DNA-binding MarR family transcriptional regulator|nr:hypothetical protein [Gammaproteobacteria bacterium]
MKRILLYVIGNLLQDCKQLLDKKLHSLGLTRHEWLTLLLLKINKGSLSQSDIRAYTGIEDSYLTKVLDKLEKKHFITRKINLNDRRSRLVKLAKASKQLTEEVLNSAMQSNETLLTELNARERRQLFQLLNKIQRPLA